MSDSQNPKKGSFFGGAAILAAGSIVVKLIGALYKIPLGNILSNEAFVDFNAAYNIYNFFLTISTAGLPVALSKIISEAHTLGRENQVRRIFSVALRTFLFMGAVSFLMMSVFGGPLSKLIGDPSAIYCVRALSPSVLCVCVMASFRGYYQGHSNMVPTAVSQIIEASCKLVFGLLLARAVLQLFPGEEAVRQRMSAVGAIAGVSIGSVIALFYMFRRFLRDRRRLSRRRYTDKPDRDASILSHLLELGVPITLGSAAVSIVTIVDTAIVLDLLEKMYIAHPELITDAARQAAMAQAGTLGADTVELYMAKGLKGIYDKCMAVYNLPSQLMVPVTASVIPAVSACLARRDRRSASKTSESALRIGAMLCLPMGIGLCALAGPIVELLFPGKMDNAIAGPIMAELGIASIFVCIMLLCNSILQAHGIVSLPMVTVAVGGVVKIVVNYILVGNYDINIKGAPIGTLCCFAAASATDLFFIHRAVPHPPKYSRVFVKPLLASVIMGFAAWSSYGLLKKALFGMTLFQRTIEGSTEVVFAASGNAIATLTSILVGVIVYAILILVLRAISPDDLALMPQGDKLGRMLRSVKNLLWG